MTFPLHLLARCLLVLVVAVTAVHATPPARADDASIRAAKRHFARGEKLFALGRFDEALEAYQQAYDAEPIPDFLFNIGQCYRNLGEYDAAIFSYRKFLKLDPDAPNREQVEQLIEDLEDKQDEGEARRFGFTRKPQPPAPAPVQPPPPSTPVYKEWWFWTGIAVVGVAGGAGIYAITRTDGAPDTTLDYNIVFGK